VFRSKDGSRPRLIAILVKPLDFHSRPPKDVKKRSLPFTSRTVGSSSRNSKATAAAQEEEKLPDFPGPAAPPPSYESHEPKVRTIRRFFTFTKFKGPGEGSSSKQPEAGPSSSPSSGTWKYYDNNEKKADGDRTWAERMQAIYEEDLVVDDEAAPPDPTEQEAAPSIHSLGYVDEVGEAEIDSDDEEDALPPRRPYSEFAGDLNGKIRQALSACQQYRAPDAIHLERDAPPVVRVCISLSCDRAGFSPVISSRERFRQTTCWEGFLTM
jgi:hypothetical protein